MIQPPGFFVSPRDLCVARRWKNENGVFVIMKKSIQHPKCPEVEGRVRAKLQMQLLKLVPIKNGTETEVTHIHLLEFGGWVPSAIVQRVRVYFGEFIWSLGVKENSNFISKKYC